MVVADLYLIRHAQSEGNVALGHDADHGRSSLYARQVRERPHWLWRLSPEGRRQAAVTGSWLCGELTGSPTETTLVTSPHLRAVETAALLAIPDAQWDLEPEFGEREWGTWADMPAEFQERELGVSAAHPFDWSPPGGESMSSLVRRVRAPLDRLLAEAAATAVVVSHADTLRAVRYLLAGHTPTDPRVAEPIPNCGVLHFSRLHPLYGTLAPRFRWSRIHCPWRDSTPSPMTEDGPKPRYSTERLLELIDGVDPIPW